MNKCISLLAILLTIPLFGGVPNSAEDATPLAKGTAVPEVTLQDIDGNAVDLKAKVAGNPAVLIFYRGSWCPYCNKHLSALIDIEEDLQTLGYELIAISPDKPEGLKEAVDKNELNYTLLSDSSAEAAKAFGLAFKVSTATRVLYKGYGIDLEKASGEDHHILPIPAVIVVDGEGIIQYLYSNPDYKIRLSPAEVLEAARKNAE